MGVLYHNLTRLICTPHSARFAARLRLFLNPRSLREPVVANPPRPRFLCHIPLIAEIGVEILLACKFENSLRKISLPRQCRDCLESVALGAGVVAASSREDYGIAPPTEVEQHRLPAPPEGLTPTSDIFANTSKIAAKCYYPQGPS